ncbi:MAG: helix-turn-helix domain-containing protein [Saprospiraceae bacterium]
MIPTVVVILTDAERRIQWVNDDFTTVTGYTLTEVIGKKPSILQGAESDPEVINRIRQGLSDQVSIKEQILNYKKDGTPYFCNLVIHPVFTPDNILTNYIAFEIDGNIHSDEGLNLLQLNDKYRTSSLKGVEELKLYTRLRHAIEEEELYLEPDLNLRHVAERLSTNTKYLSQVVNHQTGVNFQQFINRYRVARVQEKLKDKALQNLTLFGVALQCGFKNKSTFYKVFKDVTGQTPRSYLKNI